MEYISDKEIAVDRIDTIYNDIWDERLNPDGFSYENVSITCLFAAAILPVTDKGEKALLSVGQTVHENFGDLGLLFMGELPLSILFGFYVRNEIKRFWQKQECDFSFKERSRLKHDSDDLKEFPYYSRKDVEKKVRSQIEKETGTTKFLALKKMFKDRSDDVAGYKPYVVMSSMFLVYMAVTGYVAFNNGFDDRQIQSNKYEVVTP